MLRRTILATGTAAAVVLGSAAAQAQIEIQWWHAMTGANNDVIEKLAKDFNDSQKDYKVVATYKGSYPDTMNAGIAAYRAGNAPHIMQVFEVGTATMMAAKGAIKPVQDMMKEAGEKFDPKSYLPAIAGYYSTAKGEMLSFPFNSSSAIMWYNKDAFKKAGLDPEKPPKTWPETFEAAKKLKAAGHATCGMSTAWITWLMIEQFSAWHNLPLGTKANGMDGFDTEFKFNSPLHVKHLQNLVDLQKDKTFDYGGRTNTGEGRFTSGECPIMLTSSAFYGNVKANAKFEFGASTMPYYPEAADEKLVAAAGRLESRASALATEVVALATSASGSPAALVAKAGELAGLRTAINELRAAQSVPQNSIIGGASLWVMGGKKAEEYKGVAKFFTFLSDTDRQRWLHEVSGYLPITNAAYAATKASGFYEKNPGRETPLQQLNNKAPTENSAGLRFGNLVQIRDIWAEEIEAALQGSKSPQAALDAAVARGNATLRQFERTVSR
ncbi:MAG: extracellular solute-binding protein [Alphaproteobacteria bacterium]|nr:extracellular solute-binding protein [Alphaproteobacteria bacterium]